MKVCVLGTRGFPDIQGGVEKHCEFLYPLFPSKYEFVVFRRKPYVHSTKEYPCIKFIDLPSTKIKGFETIFHSFISTLYAIKERPQIVHIHNIGPALFSPLLRLFGLKVVLTYHSPNYEHKKWGYVARNLLKFSERVAFSTSSAIIFVNKFQREKYGKKLQDKSCYIPNGLCLPHPSYRTDYIESIGLVPGKYVLAVGRITPEKGFDCLLKAFALLQNKDYRLVIAGGVETETSYYEKLRTLISSKRVVFTGYVGGEKLNQLYSHASLYVLSSNNEGFPLVLLEAMSYGLNVLVSDIPATHLVDLNEEDYFLKGNVEDLSRKLKDKLNVSVQRVYNLEDFDWKKIMRQVSQIYDEVRF
ncbi:glycosyltransferase family 4 protein [Parabacteroides pacaensis]|uniref:glycosyltransferase family 4 protein n=1 Tax=Parabacteroides pacaensis TaxID=2086575 RepID=UPI000D101ECC|nr:glycosyltransferase family 4 protein [Parabacteroides pacaensis]